MRALLYISIALSVVACVPAPKTTTTTSGSAVNSSAPYIWTSSFPKDVHISNAFSAGEVTKITNMGTAWKTAVNNHETFFNLSVSRATEITPVTNLDAFYNDGILAIYKASAAWPSGLPSYALAVTQLYGRRYNTGQSNEYVQIEHADIILNEKDYDFDTTMDSNDFDLQTVILHEMGHFLGLQHNTTAGRANTVMYPNINGDESKRTPLQADIDVLTSNYNITMPLRAGLSAISTDAPDYTPNPGDHGEGVKVVFELRADGDCVHKLDGFEVERHRVSLK
ncbi:MAG: matrixin family metalloprotease [Bacteriovoracaceae bacterium]